MKTSSFTLKMLLRPIAESITTLNDPRELLPIISRTRFDVILLDMNFRQDAVSGKEGFHWLEEILKLDAKAVVIFITAYADTEKAVQAIKQGCHRFYSQALAKRETDSHRLLRTATQFQPDGSRIPETTEGDFKRTNRSFDSSP